MEGSISNAVPSVPSADKGPSSSTAAETVSAPKPTPAPASTSQRGDEGESSGGGKGLGLGAGLRPRTTIKRKAPKKEQQSGGPPSRGPALPRPTPGPAAEPASAGDSSGLMNLMSGLMQSPAFQSMGEQLAGDLSGLGADSSGSGNASSTQPGALLEQMMPLMSQMFGGGHAAPSSTGHVTEALDLETVLSENLDSEQEQAQWRALIEADEIAQTEAVQDALIPPEEFSEAYNYLSGRDGKI